MKRTPELTIEASARGVERAIITTEPGRRGEGVALLERVLPALRNLDRLIRQGAGKPRKRTIPISPRGSVKP